MSGGTAEIRIISLLPSATEIIFALGAGKHVVGVTHECDFPEAASKLPHCTGNLLPSGLTAREVDTAVSAALKKDVHSIYSLDVDKVHDLEPSIIVTQSICAVCAVPEDTVREVTCTMPQNCQIVSSNPHTLPDVLQSVMHIGKAIGFDSSAETLARQIKTRLEYVRESIRSIPLSKPRVAVIEWSDPIYAPGHWVPDMITYSGGQCVLGVSGQKSKRVSPSTLVDAQPDIIVCAFCGYDLDRNQLEFDAIRASDFWRAILRDAQIYATNASAFFSRPGNRLVNGTELLAYILHRVPQYKPKKGSGSLLVGEQWIDLSQT